MSAKRESVDAFWRVKRNAETLSELVTQRGDISALKLILQYLRRETEIGKGLSGTFVRPQPAPSAPILAQIHSELWRLVEAARSADLQVWEKYVRLNPPSPAVLALMLGLGDRHGVAAAEQAVKQDKIVRAARATKARTDKTAKGENDTGRAKKGLARAVASGRGIDDPDLTRELVASIGCSARTVSRARAAYKKERDAAKLS